jgi:hypothetical protein
MEKLKTNPIVLKIATFAILLSGVFLALFILTFSIQNAPSEFMAKLLMISASALAYGLLGAMCYSIFNKHSTQQLSIIGVVICALAFVLNTIAILSKTDSEAFGKTIFTLFIIAFALAQISMLYKINIVNKYAAISRIIAVVSCSILYFMIIIIIWGDWERLDEKFMGIRGVESGRMYLALFCIHLAFTAATPLLNRFEEGKYEEENIAEEFLADTEEAKSEVVE